MLEGSYLQGKYGVEIRKYVNKDNSHSWVRISHGLNKFLEQQQGGRRQRAGSRNEDGIIAED